MLQMRFQFNRNWREKKNEEKWMKRRWIRIDLHWKIVEKYFNSETLHKERLSDNRLLCMSTTKLGIKMSIVFVHQCKNQQQERMEKRNEGEDGWVDAYFNGYCLKLWNVLVCNREMNSNGLWFLSFFSTEMKYIYNIWIWFFSIERIFIPIILNIFLFSTFSLPLSPSPSP